MPALGCALEDAGHLGQQVGPACGKVAEFSHRGGLLVRGEVAPAGVVPGGSGELGDQEPVPRGRETILVHCARIERASGYLKQAGNYHGNRAVGLPWVLTCLVSFFELHPRWVVSRVGTRQRRVALSGNALS